jgi:hypothetical protein
MPSLIVLFSFLYSFLFSSFFPFYYFPIPSFTRRHLEDSSALCRNPWVGYVAYKSPIDFATYFYASVSATVSVLFSIFFFQFCTLPLRFNFFTFDHAG